MRKSLLILSAALLLIGCGSVASPDRTSSTDTSGAPGRSPSNQGSGATVLTEQDNGSTVTVRPGQRLVVALASTYWTFKGSSNPSVLRPAGQPQTMPSGNCVPGGGCGVASATFDALAPGTAVITATRTSCGEAMACSPAQGTYRVTVQITG